MAQARKRELHLGAFLSNVGMHFGAWRLPDTDPLQFLNIDYFKEMALTAERAKFDMVFFAKNSAIRAPFYAKYAITGSGTLDPTTVITALSAYTNRIGLVSSESTTYNDPFDVARKFASLDHVSKGRVGWNVVTSQLDGEAQNYGLDHHVEHKVRYERAEEFFDVVLKLWHSWDEDAIVADKETGIFADIAKIHAIDHEGQWFKVRGPLNVPRSPQGYPVVVQAGGSPEALKHAAKHTEVLFSNPPTFEFARKFYADLKAEMEAYGRAQEELVYLPAVQTIVGKTEEEAKYKAEQLNSLVHPAIGVALLSMMLHFDLSGYDIDGPLPEIPNLDQVNSIKSTAFHIVSLAREQNLTIRELGRRTAASRDYCQFIGSAEQVADQIEYWFTNHACDGFNLTFPNLPGGLNDFAELVVPLLQERGIFRKEYTGTTLREHLGLRYPSNKFSREELAK